MENKTNNLIYVDQETLEVKVSVRNIMSVYKPTKEIYKIVELADKIRKTKEQFLKDIYDPAINELIQMVHEYNKENNAEYGKMVEEKAKVARAKEEKEKNKGIKGIFKKFFGVFKK